MTVIDSQLTKVYLVPLGTAVATAANIVTAIASAKELKSFTSFGDIGSTRAVQTYKVIDTADVVKSLGSFDVGNIAVEFLFDSADTAGQKEIRDIYELGTRKICIVALNDKPTGTLTNPTYKTFETAISSDMITIALDAAVVYKTTLEICSMPDTILAAVTTP